MAEVGSVSWQFNHICYFAISPEKADFDKVFEIAVENGADDITGDNELIEIFGPIEVFKSLSDSLRSAGFELDEAGLRYVPKQELSLETIRRLKYYEPMEDLENPG